MFLHIKAKPNARQNQVVMLPDGTIQVKIKAPAQDGKANDELVRFIAEKLGIAKSKIRLVSGHTAPFKKLEIDAEEDWAKARLLGAHRSPT